MTQPELIGDLLVREGLITRADLDDALEAQGKEGGKLGYHLVALGKLSPATLSEFLRVRLGIAQDLAGLVRDPAVLEMIPAKLASFYRVVPVSLLDNVLTVAMADAGRKEVLAALAQVTRCRIEPLICPADAVARALEAAYGGEKDPGVRLNPHGEHEFTVSDKAARVQPILPELLTPATPVVDWLRTAIATAVKLKTRELHVIPEEDRVALGFKLRGQRRDHFVLEREKRGDLEALLDRLARLPPAAASASPTGPGAEGRFRLVIAGRRLSALVHALATLHGRRYRLRLVDEKLLGRGAVESLGPHLSDLLGFAGGKNGLALVAGPATAGKEQLLAGLLAELKARGAVASPALIEERTYAPLPGVIQIALDAAAGRSLGPALEAVLRQAPDFIAVNEARDPRELELVFLNGARVPILSALSTSDACAALEYVCEAGLQSAAKAGVLKAILGVRAFTPLCTVCARPLPKAEAEALGLADGGGLFYNSGCPDCAEGPVQGRRAVAEWLPLTLLPVKRALERTVRAGELRKALRAEGHPLLAERALEAAKAKKLDARELAGLP